MALTPIQGIRHGCNDLRFLFRLRYTAGVPSTTTVSTSTATCALSSCAKAATHTRKKREQASALTVQRSQASGQLPTKQVLQRCKVPRMRCSSSSLLKVISIFPLPSGSCFTTTRLPILLAELLAQLLVRTRAALFVPFLPLGAEVRARSSTWRTLSWLLTICWYNST